MSSKPLVFKILTAGEGGVGKTTLLHKYVEGKFLADTKMTIGLEFFIKKFSLGGHEIALQIWDFGGQERFRFLLGRYAKGADGALLLFDLTRIITLKNLADWIKVCRGYNEELPILFIGSKKDLAERISVDDDYALEFQKEHNLFNYIKVSSKTGENVNLAFQLITRQIIGRILARRQRY